MWSYAIDQDEHLVSIKRDETVYMSVSFEKPNYKEMVIWMMDAVTQVMHEFPDEFQEFMQSVTIPYLCEIK